MVGCWGHSLERLSLLGAVGFVVGVGPVVGVVLHASRVS